MAAATDTGGGAAAVSFRLCELPDDHIEAICVAAAADYRKGAKSIAMLAATCRRLRSILTDPARIARFLVAYNLRDLTTREARLDMNRYNQMMTLPLQKALRFGRPLSVPLGTEWNTVGKLRLEHLRVMETIAHLGTTRIYVDDQVDPPRGDQEPEFGDLYLYRAGVYGPGSSNANDRVLERSSQARIKQFTALLRRHPSVTIQIEGHESTPDAERARAYERLHGDSRPLASDLSYRSAALVLTLIREEATRQNFSLVGRMSARHWRDEVLRKAGWNTRFLENPRTAGAHNLWRNRADFRFVECYFILDGVEMPSRPEAHRQAGRPYHVCCI